jgi:predicted TIM-barrel fold metal-dependent hydrolase
MVVCRLGCWIYNGGALGRGRQDVTPLMIDADQHIIEPPDLWTSRMPSKYRDVAPHVVDYPEGGDAWSFDGGLWLRPLGFEPAAGRDFREIRGHGMRYDTMPRAYYDARARLEEMDIDNTDAALIFPSVAMSASGIVDDDLYLECFRVYNDAIDDWCREGNPNRLFPIAIMPAIGVDTAVAEVERVAAKGLRGYMFNAWPSGGAYPRPEDDRFWAACAEGGVAVCLHGGGSGRQIQSLTARSGAQVSTVVIRKMHQELVADGRASGLWTGVPLAHLIFTGVLERFPKLKVALTETGAGWLAYYLEQLDRLYLRHRFELETPLPLLPSEYFRRQVKATIQLDSFAVKYRHHIGVDRIMWSSDTPHVTSTWPFSRQYTDLMLKGVPANEAAKILRWNAAEFYSLPQAQWAGAPGATAEARVAVPA